MSKGVTGLLIPIDWIEDWKEDFTDEQVGIIVRALADYQTTGMMYSGEDKMIKIVIKNCYRVIDNNLGKYEQKAKRKSADERLEILSYYFENKEKENFSFQYIADETKIPKTTVQRDYQCWINNKQKTTNNKQLTINNMDQSMDQLILDRDGPDQFGPILDQNFKAPQELLRLVKLQEEGE